MLPQYFNEFITYNNQKYRYVISDKNDVNVKRVILRDPFFTKTKNHVTYRNSCNAVVL